MSKKTPDLRRIDLAQLAEQAQTLVAQWPVRDLLRLADSVRVEGSPDAVVSVEAEGESRPVLGSAPEVWLHLRCEAMVALTCQRCLGPVLEPLVVDRSIRFVADEDLAATLDAELDDDVLALVPLMDLRELVEDELLLALPLVPRHDVCPQPLPLPAQPELEDSSAPHPFAALAKLKAGRETS